MSKEPTTNSQGLSEECHAMISRISHEVRNPVAVIHSFHQLLLLFFSNTFLHFSLPLARIDPLYPLKKLFLLTLALLLVKLSNLVYAIVKLI